MAPSSYTRVIFAEQPKGPINEKTFHIEEVPFDLSQPTMKSSSRWTTYRSTLPCAYGSMTQKRTTAAPRRLAKSWDLLAWVP
ncbi:hypothetical protein DAEQUDRAFT_484152 [Daedalea quercina L-15889]|uniref:Oxidoreductase N-terminal domain-containing protein n=1 Tax=Daedalea quercina L-15889 TaxID=1314783 RepID=A0A165MSN3_9APHY|nr:hypothetical protein DAEQUDRAFT_484152 [Daedalea quercina L-15889]